MGYSITEKCNGCSACEKMCPVDAISGEKKQVYSILENVCIDCGACGRICPEDAVLDPEKKSCTHTKKSEWRKPVFNLELCSACNECVQVCPVSCIDVSLQKQKNTNVYPYLEDEKACISCGFCEEACMLDAVNF